MWVAGALLLSADAVDEGRVAGNRGVTWCSFVSRELLSKAVAPRAVLIVCEHTTRCTDREPDREGSAVGVCIGGQRRERKRGGVYSCAPGPRQTVGGQSS